MALGAHALLRFKYDIALDATLGDLRALVAQQTGLSEFKLVHSGAVMKDDSAPCEMISTRFSLLFSDE